MHTPGSKSSMVSINPRFPLVRRGRYIQPVWTFGQLDLRAFLKKTEPFEGRGGKGGQNGVLPAYVLSLLLSAA